MSYPTNLIRSYTAATRPTAASVPAGTMILISDYGINGSVWRSNGSVWIPVDSNIRMQGLTVGVILPSLVAANLATYSQVGTTITVDNTLAHNIPATTFDGNSVYLTPSSGTLVEGIFTNFTRTGANTFTCESSISQTISGNLASTTGIKTLGTLTLPANLLGATGYFENDCTWQFLNSSNNKTITFQFGGGNYYNVSNTVNLTTRILIGMRNKNATNVQQSNCTNTASGTSSTSSALFVTSIDTTANVAIDIRGTAAAANEYICVENCSFNVWPSTLV